MNYKDIGLKPVKTNWGITIVDRNGVKRKFNEDTHGPSWMMCAKPFQMMEEYKYAEDFWAEMERLKQERSFWNRMRKRFGMKIKYKNK